MVTVFFSIMCLLSGVFGSFVCGFLSTFFFSFSVLMRLSLNATVSYIIAIIISAIVGVLTVAYRQPFVIIFTALYGGIFSGFWLACMISKVEIYKLFAIIFIVLGLFVQTKVNHGLLDSGSIIEDVKRRFNRKKQVVESTEGNYNTEPSIKKESKKIKPLVKKETKKAVPKCPSCGASLDDDSVFCIKCGNRIGEAPITAPITEAPTETLKSKEDIVTTALTEKLTSAPAYTEPHEAMTETKADVTEAPKLSLGGLRRKDSEGKTGGGLVINVDKTTEKKPTGNSHFTSADDFDD